MPDPTQPVAASADPKAATSASAPGTKPSEPSGSPASPVKPQKEGHHQTGVKVRGVTVKSQQSAGKTAESAPAEPKAAGTAETAPGAATGDSPGKVSPAEKQPEKPPAGAWADLADKEAALVEGRKALKTERETLTKERESYQAERKVFDDARALVAKGDHLGALKAIGIDLEKAQDQYLGSMREPTAEEVARKAAREELDERDRKAREDTEKKTADEKAETERKTQEAIKTWDEGLVGYAQEQGPKFAEEYDQITVLGYTAERVRVEAIRLELAAAKAADRPPKFPTQKEALDMVEADLRKKQAASKRFRPAEPVPAAEAGGDRKTEAARDSAPNTLTPDTGSVPLRRQAPSRGAKRETVWERLKKAKQEAGVS